MALNLTARNAILDNYLNPTSSYWNSHLFPNYQPGDLFKLKERIETVPAGSYMLILGSKQLRSGLDQRNEIQLRVYMQLDNATWKFKTWATTYYNLEKIFERVL